MQKLKLTPIFSCVELSYGKVMIVVRVEYYDKYDKSSIMSSMIVGRVNKVMN